jgi:hypothetical protein
MRIEGKAGCGCLILILVFFMVFTGVLVHPFTLKFIGNQFKYEDKLFPSEAIFVPRFAEDKNGELYIDAFREHWAGNGKAIWVEEDKIFGISIMDIILKMAKTRGVKETAIKKLEVDAEGRKKVDKIKERFEGMGFKRVIILVPEYASRRFHLLYGSSEEGKTLYLIKALNVSYFKKDNWWKDGASRIILLRELCSIGSCCVGRFKYGEKKQ